MLIISGKDKGKKSKVIETIPSSKRIIAEGVNLVKKHVKPKKSGEKGQTVEVPRAFNISNAKIICPKCKKAVRVGYRSVDNGHEKKIRVCKKCMQEIS